MSLWFQVCRPVSRQHTQVVGQYEDVDECCVRQNTDVAHATVDAVARVSRQAANI